MSPCESGIIDKQPTPRMKRGLTLMCKVMQNIANHVLFTKEQHMRIFNDNFLKENFPIGRRYVSRGVTCRCVTCRVVSRSCPCGVMASASLSVSICLLIVF